jgi:hypothetical protein
VGNQNFQQFGTCTSQILKFFELLIRKLFGNYLESRLLNGVNKSRAV